MQNAMPTSKAKPRRPAGRTIPQGAQSFVYFIRAMGLGLIKIGVASDPNKRLAGLRTGSPDELIVAGLLLSNAPYEIEGKLHRRFADSRVRGEWFRSTYELEKLIASAPSLEQLQAGMVAIIPRRGAEPVTIHTDRAPEETDAALFSRLAKLRDKAKLEPWVECPLSAAVAALPLR